MVTVKHNSTAPLGGGAKISSDEWNADHTITGLGDAAALDVGTTAGTVAAGDDGRFTDSREWTAETIAQAEAEAGTATTRRAWTAERVAQAIAALGGGAPSTADVLDATAGASVGAVGTYAFLEQTGSGDESNPGDTKAGSVLVYSNAGGEVEGGTSPAGTWRCMGRQTNTEGGRSTTLWLRIS